MRAAKPFSVFIARLAEAKRPAYNGAYDLARDAEELVRIARRIDAIHIRQCNGYRGELVRFAADEKCTLQEYRDNRAEVRLVQRAREIAARYGFIVHEQGDPRGLPLYLGYEGHMTRNNYSTTGIAVPL